MQRVKRFAGKTLRTARNPNITARECIELANWLAANTSPPQRKPLTGWIAVSDQIPLESDGEVLVRMRDGRCEIAWATYWHGASNAFAQWTFRDPDEDEAPTHWMQIPAIEAAHGIKENK